jgi:hypothetical protein
VEPQAGLAPDQRTVKRPARQAVADDDRGNHLLGPPARSIAPWCANLQEGTIITEIRQGPATPVRFDRRAAIPDNEIDKACMRIRRTTPSRAATIVLDRRQLRF